MEPNTKLSLRPVVDTDIALIQLWLEKPHVRTWFMEPESWLRELRDCRGEFNFVRHFITLIDEGDGIENPIGFCQYYDCTKSGEDWKGIPLEGVYSIDYMIGEETFLGKGYGGEMVRQITEAVWNDTLARRIVVEPDVKNTASRASLFSNGYVYDTDLELFFKDHPLEL